MKTLILCFVMLVSCPCSASDAQQARKTAVAESIRLLERVSSLNSSEQVLAVFEQNRPTSLEALRLTAVAAYLFYSGSAEVVGYDERWHKLAVQCVIEVGANPATVSEKIGALEAIKFQARLDGGEALRIRELVEGLKVGAK